MMTWNAAKRTNSVFVATWKSNRAKSTPSFAAPSTKSVRPTGMKTRNGLYERIIRTTCVA